jgi:acetolactate synthase-1/2/3 large subunit
MNDSNNPAKEKIKDSDMGSWAPQSLDGYCSAHAMADVLHAAGVREIFGQSCPTALYLAAATRGIKQIGFRTENAGIAMADGFARMGRRVSVVTAQNGPAAALLVAGLAEAFKASIPVIAIVQEVPRASADKNAFQEIDHEKIFSGCTKWVRRIDLPERVAEYTTRAIQIATSGKPGPVVLLVAAEVLTKPVTSANTDYPVGDEPFGVFPADRFVPSAERIEQLAELLASAKRPLIVAGGGVHISGACGELARLQELAGVPVATTNMGKGAVDEHHPLSIGVIGNTMGTRSPVKFFRPYIDSADLIVFIGSRTNENGTASWTLFPKAATYAQIDIDPEELGRNYPAMRLHGDARGTLAALCQAMQKHAGSAIADRASGLAATFERARKLHRDEIAPYAAATRTPLRPERIMAELSGVSGPITWVADASYSSIWLVQYLQSLQAGNRYITPRGIAGLGWGFPMAIGAKLAKPQNRVICLTGDGGFAHCWAELETARRHGIALTVVVLNNGVLGFQINAEESRFGTHTDVCHIGPVDHAAIARACGAEGQTVSDATALALALKRAGEYPGPFVIDVITDPDAFPPLTAFESQLIPITTQLR